MGRLSAGKVKVPGSDVNPAIPGKDITTGPSEPRCPATEPNNHEEAPMAKHTYGFPANMNRDAAITAAKAQARADGFAQAGERLSAEIIETEEHKFTPDGRLPFNRPEQARPAAEFCVVIRSSN